MLVLDKLIVENFGSFRDKKEFLFTEGINLIEAHNGKGKSTLLQAIEMLLLDVYEGSYDNYINWDANSFSTSLDFTNDTIPYNIYLMVSRARSSNGSSLSERTLSSNGKILGRGDEAKALLSKMMDPNVARYALISKQENLDNIVTAKDAERLTLIKKIKNFEFDYEVKQEIEPQIESLNKQLLDIEKEIYSLENITYHFSPEKDLVYSEMEIQEFKKQIDILQAEKDSILLVKKTISDINTSLNKTLSDIVLKTKEKDAMTSKLQIEQNSLDKLLEEGIATKTKEIEKEIQSLKETIELTLPASVTTERNKILSRFTVEVEALMKEKEALTLSISEIKVIKVIKFDDLILKDAEKKSYTALAEINELNKKIADMAKGICPLCHQECIHIVSDYEDERRSLLQYMNDLGGIIAEEQQRKADIEKEIEDNNSNKSKRLSLENTLREVTTRIDYLTDKVNSDINSLVANTNSKIDLAKLKLQREEDLLASKSETYVKDIANKKGTIALLSSTLDSMDKHLESLKVYESSLTERISSYQDMDFMKEEELTSLRDKVGTFETDKSTNIELKKYNESINIQRAKDIESLADKSLIKIGLLQAKTNYEQARTILLKDFPNYMIDESIQDIENAMNDFINNVYYKNLNVHLRSTKTVVKLEYGGKDRGHPSSRLSGCEKKLVQLSFINYFNRKLGLKCIILDEPDAAMDGERKKDLYEAILSMKNIFKQVIIVTHAIEMKQYLMANTEPTVIIL